MFARLCGGGQGLVSEALAWCASSCCGVVATVRQCVLNMYVCTTAWMEEKRVVSRCLFSPFLLSCRLHAARVLALLWWAACLHRFVPSTQSAWRIGPGDNAVTKTSIDARKQMNPGCRASQSAGMWTRRLLQSCHTSTRSSPLTPYAVTSRRSLAQVQVRKTGS